MARKFCGTEVLKSKDIATIKDITIPKARRWLKGASQKLLLDSKDNFTVLNYSQAEQVELNMLVEMLNKKFG